MIQNRIALPQVPRWSPKLHIWKVWILSFHWKKINIVAFLDHSLQFFKITCQNDPKYIDSGVQTRIQTFPQQDLVWTRNFIFFVAFCSKPP